MPPMIPIKLKHAQPHKTSIPCYSNRQPLCWEPFVSLFVSSTLCRDHDLFSSPLFPCHLRLSSSFFTRRLREGFSQPLLTRASLTAPLRIYMCVTRLFLTLTSLIPLRSVTITGAYDVAITVPSKAQICSVEYTWGMIVDEIPV
jgi:hypothetical protein